MNEDEGKYCIVCGGMVPSGSDVRRIDIDGKSIGINGLDEIIAQVKALNPESDIRIKDELVAAVSKKNYIPTKKRDAYAEALLREYRASADRDGRNRVKNSKTEKTK